MRGNIRIDCRSGENRTPIRGFGYRYSTVKLRSQYVEPPGFEPGISEPKSDVLPLHHGSMCGPPGIEPGTSRGKASGPHYRLSNKRPKCPSFRAAIGFRVTCQMKSSVFSALPPHIQMRKSHTSSSPYLPNTQSKMGLRHRQGSNLHPVLCAVDTSGKPRRFCVYQFRHYVVRPSFRTASISRELLHVFTSVSII